jgi:trans-aconitate methyltransferase
MTSRNMDLEFQDNDERKYSYDFDTIVRDHLLLRLKHDLNTKGNALELGAYKGDMTAQLLEYFPVMDVIEASPILANEVLDRFPGKVNVTTGFIEEVVPKQLYDNIFLVHTLEHLDEPESVLSRVANWLKPEGKLFVAVPNANALSRQIAVHMGLISHNSAVTKGEHEHGHRRTYSLDTLLSVLRESNLDVTEFGGVIVKPLANYQFDQALAQGIVTREFVKACDSLSKILPDLSSSIYAICKRKQ